MKKFPLALKVKSRKKGHQLFQSIFTLHFSFSSFFFNFFQFFLIFILLFSIFPQHFPFFYLFSLPHFSRLVAKNFPVESLGGTLPPCHRLLRHCSLSTDAKEWFGIDLMNRFFVSILLILNCYLLR